MHLIILKNSIPNIETNRMSLVLIGDAMEKVSYKLKRDYS